MAQLTKRKSQATGFLIFGIFALFGLVINFFWKFTPWGIKSAQQEQLKQQQYWQYINDLKNQWVSSTNPEIYVDGKVKWIYVYTTDGEQLLNRYKVGETIRSPHDRIKEQDTTSNSAELKVIAWWHAGTASDKDLHKLLESHGYNRIRKNREWFELQNPLEVIPQMLAIANGVQYTEYRPTPVTEEQGPVENVVCSAPTGTLKSNIDAFMKFNLKTQIGLIALFTFAPVIMPLSVLARIVTVKEAFISLCLSAVIWTPIYFTVLK